MLKVLFTYDYELFLGKNKASAAEILFRPTEQIAKGMSEQGAFGVFFADVCSAIKHREVGLPDYSEQFDDQIRKLTQDGHDVQLHLHTNWYMSEREGDELVVSPKGYKIHEFGFDKASARSVPNIIAETKQYLEERCAAVSPDYRCIAYRAGGFGVQPEEALFNALLEAGIVIDSSVNPYLYSLDTVNSYDFRNVPKELNWRIDPHLGISVAASKGIWEIPVATAQLRPLEMIGRSKADFKLPTAELKGEYVKTENSGRAQQAKWKRLLKRIFAYRNLSLDTRTYTAILKDLEYIYNKYDLHKKDRYVCLICHPKLADQARVDNISRLIEELKKRPGKYQIVTCMDVYRELIEGKLL